MSEMKDRIRQIMDSKQMSQKEFAQFTGISEGSLSGVFNGRTRPTLQMIESIHDQIPTISVEWIMFGKEPMYVNEKAETLSSSSEKLDPSSSLLDVQPSAVAPTLFDSHEVISRSPQSQLPVNAAKTIVKYIDKPQRQITEISIFYDDQTWETFEPKR